MPGITDPGEEYFKNGLWAWVTDQWKKLIGDDAGHLQVDVVESGLPSGAATSAKQDTLAGHVDGIEGLLSGGLPSVLATDSLKVAEQSPLTGFATSAHQTTMITALQLIDDLRAALNSVATDELDVVIDGQTTDVEITQTAAADLTPGVEGWDGSAWRKLPLLWGYSDRWAEAQSSLTGAAGDRTLNFTAVPSGEVWVLLAADAIDATTNPAAIRFRITASGVSVWLKRTVTPGAGIPVMWNGRIVLKEGDYIQAYFKACALDDDLYASVVGYKMKVAE